MSQGATGIVTARWKAGPGGLTRARADEDYVTAAGRVVASEGDLVTIEAEGGARVVVRRDWIAG